jgi:hypothetical protein
MLGRVKGVRSTGIVEMSVPILYGIAYVALEQLFGLGDLRYLMYFFPIVLLGLAVRNSNIHLSTNRLVFIMLFVIYAAAFGNFHDVDFYRNVILISACLFCFVPKIEVRPGIIDAIFVSIVIVFIVKAFYYGISNFGIDILTSSSLEGVYDGDEGLLGVIFSAHYYMKGSVLGTVASVALTVLGGKRISVGAISLGFVVFHVLRSWQNFESYRGRFGLMLVAVSIINLTSLFLTQIVVQVFDLLNIDLEIERFFAGRFYLSQEVGWELNNKTAWQLLFGSGAGACDSFVSFLTRGDIDRTHNDWLKLYYDYGTIGSISFTIFFAGLFAKSVKTSALGIVVAVIMMTDNVLIYAYFQIVVALGFAYCGFQDEAIRNRSLRVHFSRIGKLLGYRSA